MEGSTMKRKMKFIFPFCFCMGRTKKFRRFLLNTQCTNFDNRTINCSNMKNV